MKHAHWKEVTQSKIQSLELNRTWTMQQLPPRKKALGCKWVYRVKYHSDGTIKHFKSQLVILSNHQVEGINYTETFAPIAKMVTVCTVLTVAATKAWELHQMDVHNVFLHEEVFMKCLLVF